MSLTNLISLGVFHMQSRPKGEALSCGTVKSEIITTHCSKNQTWNIIPINLRYSVCFSRVASYLILYQLHLGAFGGLNFTIKETNFLVPNLVNLLISVQLVYNCMIESQSENKKFHNYPSFPGQCTGILVPYIPLLYFPARIVFIAAITTWSEK